MKNRGTYRGVFAHKSMWEELDYFFIDEKLLKNVGRIKCVDAFVHTDHKMKVMQFR